MQEPEIAQSKSRDLCRPMASKMMLPAEVKTLKSGSLKDESQILQMCASEFVVKLLQCLKHRNRQETKACAWHRIVTSHLQMETCQ